MMRIIHHKLALVICLLSSLCLKAQFKSSAVLGPVTKTGFYAVAVTPELSGYIKTDFSDLRVVDDAGKQAAYIIQRRFGTSVKDTSVYKPLSIITKQQADSGKTIVVIANPTASKLQSVALLIGNASVNRTANISGSNDDNHWYSIAENVSLERKFITDTDRYAQIVTFPLVSYRFIRLVIYNGKNDPLNIISAGRYQDYTYKTVYPFVVNPVVNYIQRDSSDGYSYVDVHGNLPYHTDKVVLTVKGPRFFKREAEVLVPYSTGAGFTLQSDTVFNLEMPVFATANWRIGIYNGDNPPLKITGISTYQQSKNIVAWLDSGKAYHLEMNNATAVAPRYDLQAFKDSIPVGITTLQYGKIETLVALTANTNSYFKQWWLWAIVIAILAGLSFFSWQLTKEMAKKQ